MQLSNPIASFAIEPDEFIEALFRDSESMRNELARKLHDQMGGLMVAAAMDISWAEANMRNLGEVERRKFARIREVLKEAIDLKRVIIEQLRPTLLDTFGLFSAVRWLVKNTCLASDVRWTERYLDPEPQFKPAAAIMLFRIVQDCVALLLLRRSIHSLDLSIDREADNIVVRIAVDGEMPSSTDVKTHAFVVIQHRVRSLRGEIRIAASDQGRSVIAASVPCGELVH